MSTKNPRPRAITIKFEGTPEQNLDAFERLCEALTGKPPKARASEALGEVEG